MHIYQVLAIFLTISLTDCNTLSMKNETVIVNNSVNSTLERQNKDGNNYNKTVQLEIHSEGGPILPKLTPLTLPTENHTNLITLDKEIGKTKEKSIVARKGVVFNPLQNSDSGIVSSNDSRKDRIDTTLSKIKTVNNEPKIEKDYHINSTIEPKFNVSVVKTQKVTTQNESLITTAKPLIHKKPLILSYEALGEIGQKPGDSSITMAKVVSTDKPPVEIGQKDNLTLPKAISSTKSIVTDQLPSPNIKIHTMNASGHPGMIMPIVITILVVPTFAFLGYMALRKGKEAWKNRHYKRMDFLLDGMYND